MKMNAKRSKKQDEHIFLKMWLRTGIPILFVTITALYLFLNFLLVSIEFMKGGHRVEIISSELALTLSQMDLTDRAAVEKRLDLSIYDMAAILFDPDGREVARSNLYDYTGTEDEVLIAKYREMEETMLEVHAGKDIIRNNQVNAFGYNEWFAEGPVLAPQGEYMLYCAGVTAVWLENKEKLAVIGSAVFAVMFILAFLIALSCYRIYRKQQMLEAAYSQKVNALAHNLKTPMMVISGYSENLLAEIQTGKSVHYAEKILENVSQMNTIVDEVLEFTR